MAAQYPKLPPGGADQRAVANVLNLAMDGKINAVTAITLAAGASSTILTDSRIGADSFIGLAPLTANAAAALATTYIAARGIGSATVAHANNGQTDRTFTVLIIG